MITHDSQHAASQSPVWRRRAVVLGSLALLLGGTLLGGGFRRKARQTARIVGPSMAMTLLGTHGSVTCLDCGFPYRFDLEAQVLPRRLVCPNCGRIHDGDEPLSVIPGQEVVVESAGAHYRPRRWDVIALQTPDDPGRLSVKRVAGLPGERVAIRHGELLINGERLVKEPSIAEAVRVLVHDSRFCRSPKRGRRGELGESCRSPWKLQDTFLGGITPAASAERWRVYHHENWFDIPGGVRLPATVLDYDPYNARHSRRLNDSLDLELEVDVGFHEPRATVELAGHDGWRVWRALFRAGQVELHHGERIVATAPVPPLAAAHSSRRRIGMALRDGYVWTTCAGTTVLRWPLPAESAPPTPTQTPWAVAPQTVTAEVHLGRVWRDVYWLNPAGEASAWDFGRALGPEEYFVLGDNPPVSVDSRHFGPVLRSAIVGRVVGARGER